MALDKYAYLGKAVAYPLHIVAGSVSITNTKEVIYGSLRMILTTPLETRELLPDYGSGLDRLYWEPNDEILGTLLRVTVTDAIDKWERRIKLLDVQTAIKGDAVLIRLVYRILASNQVDSYIFPFYRKALLY